MKEFKITENDCGIRLDKFMAKVMPLAKSSEIYKSLRKKKVRINGKHQDGSYRLANGDTVQMYISDEFFQNEKSSYAWRTAKSDISVIYEDSNIIVANKPSGVPSQDIGGNTDSLESRIRGYLYKKGEIDFDASPVFIPSLCHRIDRNTSGLVIAAKNSAALRIINQKIKNKEIRKYYLCETERAPKPLSGTIKGWLLKDEKQRKMLFYNHKVNNSTYCETFYTTVRQGTPALVEAELLTGRTHQIRACLSHIGCPLVGDIKYGAKYDGKKEFQHLTSHKLIFDFNTDSGILDYLKGKTITLQESGTKEDTTPHK